MTNKSAAFIVILTFFAATIFFSKNILNADQGIYEQKCSKCHSLRKPEIYTKKEWKYNVERMAKRAGLTSDEIESIINLHPE
jgi:hypothetical protein